MLVREKMFYVGGGGEAKFMVVVVRERFMMIVVVGREIFTMVMVVVRGRSTVVV